MTTLTLEKTAETDLRILEDKEMRALRNTFIKAQQHHEAVEILTVPGYGVEIKKS